ncbi:MAG: GNAT family N-acetyltransferase [Acidobacteria bacterium]|nr:GNAT family N-acetyltransferase [Acidobacteriota bacterium]
MPRTEQEIQTIITDFRVISYRKTLLTCGILEFYTPQVAELRSLAVSPGLRGAGLGRRLAAALVDEARRRGAEMVFALTYSTEFFAKLGFSPVSRQLLPWKVWKDCLRCPKHECCDESAVARWLKPRPDSRPLFPILPSAPLAGRA